MKIIIKYTIRENCSIKHYRWNIWQNETFVFRKHTNLRKWNGIESDILEQKLQGKVHKFQDDGILSALWEMIEKTDDVGMIQAREYFHLVKCAVFSSKFDGFRRAQQPQVLDGNNFVVFRQGFRTVHRGVLAFAESIELLEFWRVHAIVEAIVG